MTGNATRNTYPAVLVTLDDRLLTPPEPALVDELWELLLHQLFDFGNSSFESLLASAGHMQIQRRVLVMNLLALSHVKSFQQSLGLEPNLPPGWTLICPGNNFLG